MLFIFQIALKYLTSVFRICSSSNSLESWGLKSICVCVWVCVILRLRRHCWPRGELHAWWWRDCSQGNVALKWKREVCAPFKTPRCLFHWICCTTEFMSIHAVLPCQPSPCSEFHLEWLCEFTDSNLAVSEDSHDQEVAATSCVSWLGFWYSPMSIPLFNKNVSSTSYVQGRAWVLGKLGSKSKWMLSVSWMQAARVGAERFCFWTLISWLTSKRTRSWLGFLQVLPANAFSDPTPPSCFCWCPV